MDRAKPVEARVSALRKAGNPWQRVEFEGICASDRIAGYFLTQQEHGPHRPHQPAVSTVPRPSSMPWSCWPPPISDAVQTMVFVPRRRRQDSRLRQRRFWPVTRSILPPNWSGRFEAERQELAAIAPTTDSSILTAVAQRPASTWSSPSGYAPSCQPGDDAAGHFHLQQLGQHHEAIQAAAHNDLPCRRADRQGQRQDRPDAARGRRSSAFPPSALRAFRKRIFA